ncbi:hypothetical protein RJ495_005098 [Pluralibacter gergoviae]|nr:hypothetical protein [Pluralibacter gergoviae]ELD4303984.1 hypothetical protein [Pluralibacter gergoviae]
MNYIDRIKKALKPELHEVEINEIKFWVHRPSIQDLAKCDSLENTLMLCVKDENGDPIFANEDIEGRVNVSQLDYVFGQKLYHEVVKLTGTDSVEQIEKK